MSEPQYLVPDAGPVYAQWGRPISNVVVVADFVFVCGQVGLDDRFTLVSADFEPQLVKAFENLEANLRAAGCELADVVKVTTYLHNTANRDIYNEIYSRYFSPPYPVRVTVGANLMDGMLVELEVVAYRRSR